MRELDRVLRLTRAEDKAEEPLPQAFVLPVGALLQLHHQRPVVSPPVGQEGVDTLLVKDVDLILTDRDKRRLHQPVEGSRELDQNRFRGCVWRISKRGDLREGMGLQVSRPSRQLQPRRDLGPVRGFDNKPAGGLLLALHGLEVFVHLAADVVVARHTPGLSLSRLRLAFLFPLSGGDHSEVAALVALDEEALAGDRSPVRPLVCGIDLARQTWSASLPPGGRVGPAVVPLHVVLMQQDFRTVRASEAVLQLQERKGVAVRPGRRDRLASGIDKTARPLGQESVNNGGDACGAPRLQAVTPMPPGNVVLQVRGSDAKGALLADEDLKVRQQVEKVHRSTSGRRGTSTRQPGRREMLRMR